MTGEELAIVPQRELSPQIWAMINDMAPVMHMSRLFGVTSKEAAAAIMLKGYELGLGITASFEFIQVIQGKPALSPRGALALLLNHPVCAAIDIQRMPKAGPFVGYECFMRRKGGFEYLARFTMEDAQRAGLIKPGSGWANYPENMCLWRAVGFAADVVFPDVTAGMTALMKMPEQYGVALTETGDVVEASYAVVPGTSTPAPAAPESTPSTTFTNLPTSQSTNVVTATAVPAVTLEQLLEVYTAEQIIVAGEGKLPSSDEEVAALAAKLAGGA